MKHREVEQAVFATFLHSQPIGQKALTRELMLLLGSTRPDKIELEKALLRWTETSWFLDEGALADGDGSVRTIYGTPRHAFPMSVTQCLGGIHVASASTVYVLDASSTVYVLDACQGFMLALERR